MAPLVDARARITSVATALVAVVLSATVVAVVAVQRQELLANLDRTLELRADELLAEYERSGPDAAEFASSNDEDRLAQLVGSDGTVLAATPNLAGGGPLRPGERVDRQIVRTVHDLPVEDDSFRLLSRPVVTVSGPAVLHVAENVDDLRDSVGILSASLLVAVPLSIALLAVLVWWLVGRTLRPVEAIRIQVADIRASDLGRRVPEPPTGDEIARLAVTMNAMLDRLQDASERERRFVADASHELRSPLTRIRAEIDVALAHPTVAGSDDTLRSVSSETIAMQRLVEDLLHLAQSDEPASPMRREPVDLDDVVLREARRARAAGHRIDLAGVSAAQVSGDSDQLTRMVRNLLDNAVRHATEQVSIGLGEHDGVATLVVDDDGPGVPQPYRQRAFDRFARVDDARSRDGGGTGLGLAIVQGVVARHGGRIRIDDAPGGGARFVVEFPVAP